MKKGAFIALSREPDGYEQDWLFMKHGIRVILTQ